MKIQRNTINNIPTIIWGEKSKKVFISVHGNKSCKDDKVIRILAESAIRKGYQVLSFDLPEHGERSNNDTYLCNIQNCVSDLKQIIEYAKSNYEEINLWACSMGAFFSLVAYKEEDIKHCLFLSPVVDMKIIIDNMMLLINVTEEELKQKQEIKTEFGQTLYWDYYEFVKNNPITSWNIKTDILYGDKDNLQDEELMKGFCNRFTCDLSVLINGEHFFHTEEQLDFYRKWLDEKV